MRFGHSLITCALVFGLMLFSGLAAAEVFKVVGPDGTISYTDTPSSDKPYGSKLKLQKLSGQQPFGKPLAAKQYSSRKSSRTSPAKVTIYTKSRCQYCVAAKEHLATIKVPFEEVDIETEDGGKRYEEMGETYGVPIIWVDKQKMVGYSEAELDDLLRQSGYSF